MSEFRYTPNTVAAIRRHVDNGMTDPELCRRLGCTMATLRNVAREHRIRLNGAELRPELVEARLNRERLQLNPEFRRINVESAPVEIEPATRAVSRFKREADRRSTTAAVLMAVALERIAADDLFAALFDDR